MRPADRRRTRRYSLEVLELLVYHLLARWASVIGGVLGVTTVWRAEWPDSPRLQLPTGRKVLKPGQVGYAGSGSKLM